MQQALEAETADVDTRLAARSKLYSLFAQALSHPSDEILDAFISGEFDTGVTALMKEAGYHTGEDGNPVTATPGDAQSIKTAYATAFEAGLPKVSLREANYVREGEKVLFEDLFRFYDHFGLDTSTGALREWPDHIGVELEFMHYLTWLEAGSTEAAPDLRRAQTDFLTRHIAHWTDELAARLADKNITAPWPQIARRLARFIREEANQTPGAPARPPGP